ncbi:MAG: hypothetical protein IBX63_02010 [Coriobacteriia bacterium]|nr:hypothetical protein [Coriobacteriia bacterium]
MGFFLLRRDGDAVALIASTVFGTRQEALAEVSRMSAAGAPDADEIFVIDLDAATPVLIVAPSPSLAVEGLPVEEAPSAPDEPEEDSAPGEGVATSSEAAVVVEVEEPIAEAILADVGPAEEQKPETEAALEEEVAEPDVVAETEPVMAAPEPELEPEEPVEAEDLESIPVSGPAPPPESVVQSWPWDTTPEPPEPVVAIPEAPLDEDDQLPEEVSGLLADLEEILPAAKVADAVVAEVAVSESEDAAEESASVEPPKAYEAGASDITTLTCDDCIYLNTCPKKGESDPSSCGSFQWRSV